MAAHKSLKIENPVDTALQFFSTLQGDKIDERPGKDDQDILVPRKAVVPIQHRAKSDKSGKELKRKRFNLLFLPSLFETIEKIAYVEKITINEAVNRAIKLYCDSNKDILAKHAEIEKLKVIYPTTTTVP